MNDNSKVVSLQFDNEQFKKAVGETLTMLKDLDDSLNRVNSGKSLGGLASAASLNPMISGIQAMSSRFSTFGIVGMTVIQRLTNAGIDMVKNIGSGFGKVIQQMKEGGFARAANLEQAKFLLEGLGADVEGVMTRVNNAVDGTAYGLDEAAKAAASFFASGVTDMDKLESSLTAVSGAAAMTGDSYANMADIFTTVAGQGKLMTEQLRMFEGRGLNVAALLTKTADQTSIFWGKTEEEVRDMVTKGLVDFDSFSSAMDELFGEHAKDANKTFSGSLANMKTALSRFGEAFITPAMQAAVPVFNSIRAAIANVLGVLKEDGGVVERWTKLSKNAGKAMSDFIEAINPTQKNAEGDTVIVKQGNVMVNIANALTHLYTGLLFIFASVKNAFLSVFPNAGINTVVNVGKKIEDLALRFEILVGSTNGIKNAFIIFFNTIKIGANLIKGFFNILYSAFSAINDSTGIIDKVLNALKSLTNNLADTTDKTKIFEKTASGVSFIFENIGKAITFIADTIKNFANDAIDGLINKFKTLLGFLSDFLKEGTNLSAVFAIGSSLGTASIMGALAKGIFDLTSGTKKTLSDFAKSLVDNFSKIPETVCSTLDQLSSTLSAMQTEVKGKALMEIGIGLLAIAIAIGMLAKLNVKELSTGLGGIAASMGILLGGFAIITKILDSMGKNKKLFQKSMGSKDILVSATAIMVIAGAILMLSAAVKNLSSLNPEELAKGLGSVAVLMGEIAGFMAVIGKNDISADISLRTGLSLIAIAYAMKVMSEAVDSFGKIDTKTLIKGLGSVCILMISILGLAAGFDSLDKKSVGISTAVYILALAGAMKIMADAVSELGSLDSNSLIKGISTITLFMAEMMAGAALLGKYLNEEQLAQFGKVGIAMVAMSVSMKILASALSDISSIDPDGLTRSMMAIVTAMVAFSVAADAMSGTTSGAGSMLLMASAMLVLAGAFKILGSMSLASIGKALLTMAVTFGILGATAALLSPLSGVLLAIGGALLMMGASVALVGGGILMLATGLSMLGTVGTAAITTLITLLNQILIWLGSSIQQIAQLIVGGILAILQSIVDQAPAFIEAIVELLDIIITAVTENIDKIVDLGIKIIESFLLGLSQSISIIAGTAAQIVAGFIEGIADNMDPIVQSGFDLMLSFIYGLANGVRGNAEAVRQAVFDLCLAILEAFCTFFGIASPSKVMDEQGRNLISGLVKGIKKKIKDAPTAVINGIKEIPGKIKDRAEKFLSAGEKLIGSLIKGLGEKKTEIKEKFTTGVENAKTALANTSFYQLGQNLIQGFLNGLNSLKNSVTTFWNWLSEKAKQIVQKKNDIRSPSKVYFRYGRYIMQGFINGLNALKDKPVSILEELSDSMANVNYDIDTNNEPVIKPVVDLSDAMSSMDSLNSMFNEQQTMRIGGEIANNVNNRTSIFDAVKQGVKSAMDGLEFGGSNTYNVNGVTYDDGSNITSTVETLIHAIEVEGRM